MTMTLEEAANALHDSKIMYEQLANAPQSVDIHRVYDDLCEALQEQRRALEQLHVAQEVYTHANEKLMLEVDIFAKATNDVLMQTKKVLGEKQ
jgi:hypothetical protein